MLKPKILIIEDDALNRDILRTMLNGFGDVDEAATSEEGLNFLESRKYDLSFIDLNLNGKLSGFKLAKLSKEKGAYTTILSGQKDQDSIKKGFEFSKCDNYLFKPANLKMIRGVFDHYSDQHGSIILTNLIQEKFPTNSPKVKEVLEIVKTTYQSSSPLYIYGPTGSGKQVLAELVHELKYKTLDNFHHLNCSAFSDTLLESELFGHVKGAFTGADSRKIGLLEKANGGTLFLDEIATMSPAMQNKVITAIEAKKFRPVGSDKEIHSEFRLIAATSSDLSQEVSRGNFRSDLFFRINGIHLTLPALKDRKEDLNDLVEKIASQHDSQKALYLSKDLKDILQKYDWPGNIRELRNLIFSFLDRNISQPKLTDLPSHIINNEDIFNKGPQKYLTKKNIKQLELMGLRDFLQEIEAEAIKTIFEKNQKRVRSTARILKVHTDRIYTALNREQGVQYDFLQ